MEIHLWDEQWPILITGLPLAVALGDVFKSPEEDLLLTWG